MKYFAKILDFQAKLIINQIKIHMYLRLNKHLAVGSYCSPETHELITHNGEKDLLIPAHVTLSQDKITDELHITINTTTGYYLQRAGAYVSETQDGFPILDGRVALRMYPHSVTRRCDARMETHTFSVDTSGFGSEWGVLYVSVFGEFCTGDGEVVSGWVDGESIEPRLKATFVGFDRCTEGECEKFCLYWFLIL